MVSPRALWRPGTPDIETTGLWCHHIRHLICINLLGIPLKNIQMKLKMNAVPDYIWLLCLINNRTSTWIWEFKKPHHQQRAYQCIRLPLSGPRSLATASQTVRQHWSTSALRTWHGAPHQQEIYGIYWFVLEPKQLLWIGPRWEELQNMTWQNRPFEVKRCLYPLHSIQQRPIINSGSATHVFWLRRLLRLARLGSCGAWIAWAGHDLFCTSSAETLYTPLRTQARWPEKGSAVALTDGGISPS